MINTLGVSQDVTNRSTSVKILCKPWQELQSLRDGGGETAPLTEDMLRRYLSEMDLFGSEKARSSPLRIAQKPSRLLGRALKPESRAAIDLVFTR